MRIFVVNMKTSVKRRKIMEEQLNKLGLRFEIFEAVQGDSLSEQEIMSYYDKDFYTSRPSYFTPGAAGCTLSHYFLYKKMVEENIETALILEDDMHLSNDLPEILEKCTAAIRGKEVVMLFYQSYDPIHLSDESAVAVSHAHKLLQVVNIGRLRSTAGYIINYAGAKSMVEKLLPFSAFPDDWKNFYDRQILNGIRVLYPLVLENTYEPTTISPNIKGGALLKKIIQMAETYNVFPIYQLLKRRRKINIAKSQQCFIVKEAAIDYRKS